MKGILGAVSLTLLMVLIWIHEVPAQSWDFIYEGNEIPDDPVLGDDAWNVKGTSEVCEIIGNGELHIDDPDDKTCHLLRDAEEAGKGTLEARVKVLSQSGPLYTILMGIEDAVGYAWLDLFPDYVQIDAGGSYNVDMTEYHILRITRDEDEVIAYVDDEEVLKGGLTAASDRQGIIFGSGSTGGTGEHYWDYVVYTLAGAFSPEALPNYLSTLAVESKGKAATCWGMIKSEYSYPNRETCSRIES